MRFCEQDELRQVCRRVFHWTREGTNIERSGTPMISQIGTERHYAGLPLKFVKNPFVPPPILINWHFYCRHCCCFFPEFIPVWRRDHRKYSPLGFIINPNTTNRWSEGSLRQLWYKIRINVPKFRKVSDLFKLKASSVWLTHFMV